MKIIVLEDNAERRAAMSECLRERLYTFDAEFFSEPAETIEHLRGQLDNAILISLDHDMELIADDNGCLRDPGTGRKVADFLAERAAVCPVVIHSTNSAAAIGMEQVLADAGWSVSRVAPYGDLEWVHEAWLPAVRHAILTQAHSPSLATAAT